MKLVHGQEIQRSLRKVSPTRIAVAYVGIDWKDYIDAETLKEIVLSPTIGTNPDAVGQIANQLGWENVYFLDNLHAKIYLGNQQAAVGSFNLTANGMSAEVLQEVGFIVEDLPAVAKLRELLESYKQQATRAYPTKDAKLKRLARLRESWNRAVRSGVIRNDAKPKNLTAYQPLTPDEIYVCWVSGEIEYNENVVSPAMIKDCVSLLETDDVKPDRWVLCWDARKDGTPSERGEAYWLHIDEVIARGAKEEPYTKLAIERANTHNQQAPFELTHSVISALRAVLRSGKFPEFLGATDLWSWSLNPTLPRLPAFFEALRNEVRAQSEAVAPEKNDTKSLKQRFSERIREAMDISLANKYVTHSINGMLKAQHAVEVAKKLVLPGSEIKSGLKKLAKAKALHLSFESIMLEKQFTSLFPKQVLERARFNLLEADPTYQPPSN